MTSTSPAPATGTRLGIPTARAVDHMAFTVGDLERAIQFFVEVVGGELCYREGPVEDPRGDWMLRKLGVHPRATAQVAMVNVAGTANVELFGYSAPQQRRTGPTPGMVGGVHLALQVDDLDAALRYLHTVDDVEILDRAPDLVPPDTRRRWLRTAWGMWLLLCAGPVDRRRYRPSGGPPRGRGLPGLRGVAHLGRAVADLDAAITFFRDVLDAEPLGPPTASQAEPRHVALRVGPTANVELIAGTPDPHAPLRNSDVGGHHLAFYVADVDTAAAYLRQVPGVTVMGDPETITTGPLVGDRWVYFDTPIGIQMEILRMPDGRLPYEQTTTARRVTPGPHGWRDRP